LGNRLVEFQLDLLEKLVEAYYRKEKLEQLRSAKIAIEKLRHLLQIATEMRFMSLRQLEFTTGEPNQIGLPEIHRPPIWVHLGLSGANNLPPRTRTAPDEPR
jgi:hypothetical protein